MFAGPSEADRDTEPLAVTQVTKAGSPQPYTQGKLEPSPCQSLQREPHALLTNEHDICSYAYDNMLTQPQTISKQDGEEVLVKCKEELK